VMSAALWRGMRRRGQRSPGTATAA
jgi:hypothetical protein